MAEYDIRFAPNECGVTAFWSVQRFVKDAVWQKAHFDSYEIVHGASGPGHYRAA
jgi:hypothetical protein